MKWYPQTWMYVSRIKRQVPSFGNGLQYLCKKITKHEASKTEKDYPGNGMVGQWCRWCNYFWEVPIEETPSAEYLKDIFDSSQSFKIVEQRCGDCNAIIPLGAVHHCPLEN